MKLGRGGKPQITYQESPGGTVGANGPSIRDDSGRRVMSWGLAMLLWMFLLRRLDVSQASVSIYLLPFLGVLISEVTLKEKITTTMITGGLVTLMGTISITTTEPTSV